MDKVLSVQPKRAQLAPLENGKVFKLAKILTPGTSFFSFKITDS